jgi:ankyrin repeat protein
MTDNELQSSLFKAVTQADLADIKRLVKLGADVNGLNEQGQTPLAVACYAPELKHARMIVEYFLKKGADINKHNDGGLTPLFNAVRAGRHGIVQRLLEEGANPNINLFPSKSPLIVSSAFDLVFNRYLVAVVKSKKGFDDFNVLESEIDHCRSMMFLLSEAGARRHIYEPVPEYS